MTKKIYVVIGTRAQLIKMAPLMVLMQQENIGYEFIYTAQHRGTIARIKFLTDQIQKLSFKVSVQLGMI